MRSSMFLLKILRMKKSNGSILAKKRFGKRRISQKKVHEAAVELGRKGGLVGGNARAEALTDDQRSEIARYAANVRWGNIVLRMV